METKGFSRRGFLARLTALVAAWPVLHLLLPGKASAAPAQSTPTGARLAHETSKPQVWRAMW